MLLRSIYQVADCRACEAQRWLMIAPAPQPGTTSSPTAAAGWAFPPCPAPARPSPSRAWPPISSCAASCAPDQEVLIVTLVNSAVDNFATRIGRLPRRTPTCCPGWGYRVRTLHGLAHDIVRERPEAVGLANDFQIIDEREAARILQRSLRTPGCAPTPTSSTIYLKDDLDEQQRGLRAPREAARAGPERSPWRSIRYAKDSELTPEALRKRLDELPMPLPLAEMGWALYTDYQRALNYRGAVDFDDLIRLALQALQADRQPGGAPAPPVALHPRRRGPGLQPPAGGDPAPPGRPERQLGAGGRPQPGHLRDLHHRQPRIPARISARSRAFSKRDLPESGRSHARASSTWPTT